VAERLAHQVRTHRDGVAVAQLDPLALLLRHELEHAGGPHAVEVMEQHRERDALEVPLEVDGGAARGIHGHRRRGLRLADVSLHDLDEIRERHRLGEQIEGPERVRALRVGGRGRAAADQHHREVAGGLLECPELRQDFEAVETRQEQVEQNQVGWILHQTDQRPFAVVGALDGVTF
jgi:hypothetical protein